MTLDELAQRAEQRLLGVQVAARQQQLVHGEQGRGQPAVFHHGLRERDRRGSGAVVALERHVDDRRAGIERPVGPTMFMRR